MSDIEIVSKAERIERGGELQEKFELLLEEIATIRLQKTAAYGTDTFKNPDAEEVFEIMWVDIYRKFIRIKNLCRNHKFVGEDGESLRDAFRDMAGYSVMGLQLYDQHFTDVEPNFEDD